MFSNQINLITDKKFVSLLNLLTFFVKRVKVEVSYIIINNLKTGKMLIKILKRFTLAVSRGKNTSSPNDYDIHCVLGLIGDDGG